MAKNATATEKSGFNPLSIMGDLGDILSGVNSSVSNIESGKLTQAEAQADITTYTQYLEDFPQYEQYKETAYKTVENQTLADRLATSAMRGASTAGGTSAALAYEGEKSLYDMGYTALVASLELEKTQAEGQLAVANATLDQGQSTENAGWGGLIGEALGAVVGTFILPGAGTVAGAALGEGIGSFIGGLFK